MNVENVQHVWTNPAGVTDADLAKIIYDAMTLADRTCYAGEFRTDWTVTLDGKFDMLQAAMLVRLALNNRPLIDLHRELERAEDFG